MVSHELDTNHHGRNIFNCETKMTPAVIIGQTMNTNQTMDTNHHITAAEQPKHSNQYPGVHDTKVNMQNPSQTLQPAHAEGRSHALGNLTSICFHPEAECWQRQDICDAHLQETAVGVRRNGLTTGDVLVCWRDLEVVMPRGSYAVPGWHEGSL